MAWLKYLREELPTVAFKCSTQQQATNLGQRRGKRGKADAAAEASGAALGAEQLLQLLKNYARNKDIKTAITVGKQPAPCPACSLWHAHGIELLVLSCCHACPPHPTHIMTGIKKEAKTLRERSAPAPSPLHPCRSGRPSQRGQELPHQLPQTDPSGGSGQRPWSDAGSAGGAP